MLGDSFEERQKQIQCLKEFVERTMKEINNIALVLNWDPKTLQDVGEFFVCPFDSSHRIPMESLEKHLTSCQWKAEGYQSSDLPLSEPVDAPKSSSIKFDEQLQTQVLQGSMESEGTVSTGLAERLIPRTSDRLLTDFTPSERRAMYEYVIANTVKPDIGQDLTDGQAQMSEQKNEKQPTYLELLAQERNLKRRRTKHKSVHTNKKSHTEILREVINQQMEMYREQVAEIQGIEAPEQAQEETKIDPIEEKQEPFPRILDDSGYNQSSSRHSTRPQDKREKYASREKSEGRESSRRHSHHEHRKKSRSEHHDHEEDGHRSKHKRHKKKSHKKKSHKSGKREESNDHYYSHHSTDKHKSRDKSKYRD